MTPARRSRKVTLEGCGPITLSQKNYMTTGGEGSIWRASNTVIKLYSDEGKMRRDNMPGKIRLLSGIKHPFIISPTGLVLGGRGQKPIGYYMPYIKGEPLPRVFTNDFRAREGFGDVDAVTLASGMWDVMRFVHDFGAIAVDANEFNWLARLAKGKNPEPRILDVDSWALDSWPARAVMLSIRDWHTNGFTELSDWFSWGVVTFQIFTGIHPYKGVLPGYKFGEMERRMKDSASVFSSGISLNRAVRDFSVIPGPLLDWYGATFQDGQRRIPPSPSRVGPALARAAQVKRVVTTSTGALHFDKLLAGGNDPIVRVWPSGVVLRASGELFSISLNRAIGSVASAKVEVVAISGGWLVGEQLGAGFKFYYISQASLATRELNFNLRIKNLLRFSNRLFVLGKRGLMELRLTILGEPILSIGETWKVMANSTKWFDGVGVQDAMGSIFLVAPFGDNSLATVRTPELDGLKVLGAVAGERFVSVVGADKKGEYHKFEFAFSRDYVTHSVWQGVTQSPELNIAILSRGVAATIVRDGELVVFVPSSGVTKKINEKNIATNMELATWQDQVVYIDNGDVWGVRMK